MIENFGSAFDVFEDEELCKASSGKLLKIIIIIKIRKPSIFELIDRLR